MLIPHVGMPELFLKKDFANIEIKKVEGESHWHQFIDAVRGKGPEPSANFSYSGPLGNGFAGRYRNSFPDGGTSLGRPPLTFKGNQQATQLVSRKIS